MKKLIAVIMSCALIIGMAVIPVAADEIYYPCYEGNWYCNNSYGGPSKLSVSYVTNNYMRLYFQHGQFATQVDEAYYTDKNVVSGTYREVWDDGGVNWSNYVMEGRITLTLYSNGIWLERSGTENGNWFTASGWYTSKNFSQKTYTYTDTPIMLNGTQLKFEQAPIVMNGNMLAPVETLYGTMGAKVSWFRANRHHEMGETVDFGTMNATFTDQSAYMGITKHLTGSGSGLTLKVPAFFIGDTLYVPVRSVTAFDATVSWDSNNNSVLINFNK